MAVPYYGDFAEDATVYIPFNTFSSDDPSASVTVTDLADADIMVHKDGGLTQIATDGATVAIDYDSITGNHLITIDTSVHADYAAGSEYAVRIEGVTIDGATINAWVGAFSIERAGGVLALIKATIDVNVASQDNIDFGALQKTSLNNATPSVTVSDKTGFSLSAAGNTAVIDEFETQSAADPTGFKVNVMEVNGASQTANDNGADINAILTDTGTTLDGKIDTIDSNIDSILTDTGTTLDGKIDTIDTVVDGIQADLSNGTDGLGALKALIDALNDISAADVNAEVDTALSDINLDHLCKTATGAADMTTEVADNTILSRILANGDTSAFDPSTDGLQPIRDHIGDGTNLTEAGGDGDHLTEAGGDGDHLTESGGTGDQLTAITGNTDDLADGERLDLIFDAILTDTGTTLDGKIDTIDGNVDSILTDTGTTLDGKINTIDTVVDAIKVVTDALTAAAATNLALSAGTIVAGTVSHDNTVASSTVFYSDDITEATADHYNGRIVIFTSGDLQYQATDITDYALDTGEGKFTVTALTEAPADNVTFIIV